MSEPEPSGLESLPVVAEALLEALRPLPVAGAQLWSADDLGFHPRWVLGAAPSDAERARARACCISNTVQTDGASLAIPLERSGAHRGAVLLRLGEPAEGAAAACQHALSTLAVRIDEALGRDRMARLSGSARHADRLREALTLAHHFENVDDLALGFAELHRCLCGLMRAECFFVVMLDASRQWLHYPYAVDPYDMSWEPLPVLEGGLQGCLSAHLLSSGRILRGTSSELLQKAGHSDTISQDRFGPLAHDWLGVPMRVGDEVLGALVVQTYDPAIRFADQDPGTLSMIAEALATALHRRRVRESLQRQVAERTAELEAAKHTAEQALAALQSAQDHLVRTRRLASLGRLVAGLAHELNTPLGVSVTAASHLCERTLATLDAVGQGALGRRGLQDYLADASEASHLILGNLERSSELVRVFKQAAAEAAEETPRPFQLAALLGDVLDSMHPAPPNTAVTFSLDCPDTLWMHGCPQALAQAVRELLGNALLHAIPAGQPGRVRIEVREQPCGHVRIEVEDDGVGMPADVAEQAFEPFFTTRRNRGGIGLGLQIVFSLVHLRLRGSIELDSAPGRGSRFRLQLPREIEA